MKYTIKDISRTVIIIILIGLTVNIEPIWYKFFPAGKEYGPTFNNQRTLRGILPLPPTWTTKDEASPFQAWLPPFTPNEGVVHTSKIIVLGEDSISYEQDNVAYINKGVDESLSLDYYYDSTNHWKCYYYGPAGDARRLLVDRKQADSILRLWGYFDKQQ